MTAGPQQCAAGDISDSKGMNHKGALRPTPRTGQASCELASDDPGRGKSCFASPLWTLCPFQKQGLGFEQNILLANLRSVLSRA